MLSCRRISRGPPSCIREIHRQAERRIDRHAEPESGLNCIGEIAAGHQGVLGNVAGAAQSSRTDRGLTASGVFADDGMMPVSTDSLCMPGTCVMVAGFQNIDDSDPPAATPA